MMVFCPSSASVYAGRILSIKYVLSPGVLGVGQRVPCPTAVLLVIPCIFFKSVFRSWWTVLPAAMSYRPDGRGEENEIGRRASKGLRRRTQGWGHRGKGARAPLRPAIDGPYRWKNGFPGITNKQRHRANEPNHENYRMNTFSYLAWITFYRNNLIWDFLKMLYNF